MQRANTIRNQILEDIAAGRLAFGTRITIDDLASRYGSSHMPIREALRQLAGESLVEFAPGRGARMSRVDHAFIENLFATRLALEVMLVRRATQHAGPAVATELEPIEAGLEAAVAAGDFPAALEANRAFHQAINRAARNRHAASLVDRNWILVQGLWHRVGFGPERLPGVVSDHRHLMQALAGRDVEAAGVLMGAHVLKARDDLLSRMAASIGGTGDTRSRTKPHD